tara:strand:+ start:310 stop:513 length:204 start_codon:yes stop_codon:yes gene_type:complete
MDINKKIMLTVGLGVLGVISYTLYSTINNEKQLEKISQSQNNSWWIDLFNKSMHINSENNINVEELE